MYIICVSIHNILYHMVWYPILYIHDILSCIYNSILYNIHIIFLSSLRDQVARKLVVTVQQKIFQNSCDLVSPHRYVIKHGDLKKVYNKAMRHIANKKVYLFILFNDMLLVSCVMRQSHGHLFNHSQSS